MAFENKPAATFSNDTFSDLQLAAAGILREECSPSSHAVTPYKTLGIDVETGSNTNGSTASAEPQTEVQALQTLETVSTDAGEESAKGLYTRGGPLEEKKRTATTSTAVVILKSFVGSGILFLPHAVIKSGLVLSLFTVFAVLCLAIYCMHLLVKCCCLPHSNEYSYEQLGEKAFGFWGGLLIELCVLLSQLGFCAVNIAVTAGSIRDVVWSASNCAPNYNLPVPALIWGATLVCIPLSFIKHIKYLAPLMLVANLGTAVGVTLLLAAIGMEAGLTTDSAIQSVEYINFKNWPLILGTSIYLWEGAGLVLPIRQASKKNVQEKFSALLICCLGGLALLYIIYSVICAFAFGNKIEAVVLSSLRPSVLTLTIQAVFAFAVLATYPLMLFPTTAIAEQRLLPALQKISPQVVIWVIKPAIRVVLVCMTLVVASAGLNQLDNLVALVGAVCGVPLAFVFPVILHVRLKGDRQLWKKCFHFFIIGGGIAMEVFSIIRTVTSWHSVKEQSARCYAHHNQPSETHIG